MLTVLKLHSCEGITSASMAAISHSYMLEVGSHLCVSKYWCCVDVLVQFMCKWFGPIKAFILILLQVLELDNCSLLTSVSLDLPRLKNIRLVHCRKYVCCLNTPSPKRKKRNETPLKERFPFFLAICVCACFCYALLQTVIFCYYYFCRFGDLNLRSIMLSSITVSNCPALHRINITSNLLQVCV